MSPAAAETTVNRTIVQVAIHGSCGWMPYSCVETNRPSASADGQADGKTDRQQQQDFAHHEPDHEPRLRAEREPDAQLLLPARDDEGHHAVEPDRRQHRREQAEAGGEQRDQPIGQQRLVELPFHASSSRRPASTSRAASPRFGSSRRRCSMPVSART